MSDHKTDCTHMYDHTLTSMQCNSVSSEIFESSKRSNSITKKAHFSHISMDFSDDEKTNYVALNLEQAEALIKSLKSAVRDAKQMNDGNSVRFTNEDQGATFWANGVNRFPRS